MCPLRPAVVTLMNLGGSGADNDTQDHVFGNSTEVQIKFKLHKTIMFKCTHSFVYFEEYVIVLVLNLTFNNNINEPYCIIMSDYD